MRANKDVFISFSSHDYDEALVIKGVLETNGITCWMAPESIPAGSDYTKEIPAAINSCRVFLLILSDNAQRSKWVPLELDRAYNTGKIILPFVIKNCALTDDFNFLLARTQRIDAYLKKSEALEMLVEEIQGILRSGKRSYFTSPEPKKKNRAGLIVGLCGAAAAALVLFAVLWICGVFRTGSAEDNPLPAPTEATEATVPTEPATDPPTDPPTEPPTSVPVVTDYVRTMREVVYENNTFVPPITMTFRIPEITIDSDDAREVNDEILEKYGSTMDAAEEQNSSVANTFIDYDAYLTNDILSVVINVELGSGHSWQYSVYNFDISTGKSLTNRTLCKKIGTDWDTMKKTLSSNLEYYYNQTYPQHAKTPSMYDTLGSDNLEAARLFIGSTRKIQAVCTIYIPAGSGHLQQFIDLYKYNY